MITSLHSNAGQIITWTCERKHHAMKTYVRVDVWLHAFLTLALDGESHNINVSKM